MNSRMHDAQNLARLLAEQPTLNELNADDWDRIYEIAGAQWLLGALAVVVNNLPKSLKPPQKQLTDCLNEILNFQEKRELELLRNIAYLNKRLNDLPPILWLKGADELLSNTLPKPGMRWMMDIDCYIAEPILKALWKDLLSTDFEILDAEEAKDFFWENERWHHTPTIIWKESNIAFELHRYIGRFNTRDILNEQQCLKRAIQTTDWDGNPCLVLNCNDGVIHRILHTQIMDGNIEEKSILPLRHLFNLYLYIDANQHQIDWKWVETQLNKYGYRDTLKRITYILNTLFELKTPLYSAKCKVGQEFLKSASNQHNRSFITNLKQQINTFATVVADPFLPQTVHRKYGKKPNGIAQWIHAYWLRIPDLFKKFFSLSAWKKRFRDTNKNNW